MEGRTLIRIAVVVTCLAATAAGYRNSNGDNSDAIAAATRAACGSDDCSASLTQQARGSFGHEYSFNVERTLAGKKTSKQVIVSCEREMVLVGDWHCQNKSH
jgi:DNA-binding NarL/FixJ family response regulator